ncbi:DUF6884 domain-containing protein [Halobellus rubicundus]|uniref:DUF6884 domain-containing protein n=1 Tax=Halobellus rubicundus TaxID=2996466 RepID=A0ABD5M8V8_9EURY
MTREIGLVSCVKTKRDEPAMPKELYTSDYFEKMHFYAEQYHDDWWILSAKHGLLDPDGEPIEPYDETLSGARVATKREWAERVAGQLDEEGLLSDDVTLVLHAGKDYYEELLPLIEDRGVSVEIPTEGLRIGKTKAWYKERI